MINQRPPFPPLLIFSFGILCVSTASIFIRYAQSFAPSLVVSTYRLLIASLIITPIALIGYRKELKQLQTRDLGFALLSGLFLALHFATWITSLEYTTVASSVVLVTTTPLWVALFSPFLIKEKINWAVKIGIVITFIGGIIVAMSDSCTWIDTSWQCPPLGDFMRGQAFLGDLLALTGAIMGACYIIIGRRLRNLISLVSYIFIVYGMAAIVLLSFTLLDKQSLFNYPPEAFGWFVLLALIPQLLGHSTFNWALRYISASYVAIALVGEPVAATLLAFIFLQEVPSMLKIFGAALIIAGIYIATRNKP